MRCDLGDRKGAPGPRGRGLCSLKLLHFSVLLPLCGRNDILASPPQTFPSRPPFHSPVQRVFLLFLPTGRQEGAGLRGLRLPRLPASLLIPPPGPHPSPHPFPARLLVVPKARLTGGWDRRGLLAPGIPRPSPVQHVRPPPGSQETTTPIGSLAPNPLRHWEELVHSVLPVSLESVRLEGEVNALIGGQLSVSYLEGVCVPEARTCRAAANCSTWGQLPSCLVQGPGTHPWV